ncbi:uncharacterized protein LOC110035595 [Phalaenopsis equestris]|uniref:uncharacterized protein LOC110035595 n=1 Tax=Phalaenopsis equestris TaxID=78828 RepID=UPI0009E4C000|nr:uncharacterized protein LOC110035595 [Phalaenopsis equestris]
MDMMERTANDDAAWKLSTIMLRYRPIVPKPFPAGSAPGIALEPTLVGKRVKKGEGTRRKGGSFVGKRGRKPRKVQDMTTRDAAGSSGMAQVLTLQLMSVTPERKEGVQAVGSPMLSITGESPFFCPVLDRAGVVVSPRPALSAAVSVTIESVTEVWSMGFCGITGRDDELRRWLEAGDCPAFISIVADRITWTNSAFRRMLIGEGASAESSSSSSSSYSSTSKSDAVSLLEPSVEEEVRVVLVTRGLIPGDMCQAFTCMTSLRHSCGRRGKASLAVPCDIWRLEDGCLAWRLDMKTALRLSTGI